MSGPYYDAKYSVDRDSGEILAAYFRVREGEVADTVEIVEGRLTADYDADGLLLGIEVLGPCEAEVLDQLEASPQDKDFFRKTAAASLLCR